MRVFSIFLFFPVLIFAQIPAYYQNIDFTKTGNDLKDELHQLVVATNHTILPYTFTGGVDTWTAIREADLVNVTSNNVLLVYGFDDTDGNFQTDRTRDKFLTCHTSSCSGLWNREHIFPRSLGTPDLGTEFAGADLFNLRACDAFRNSSRGNKMYGDAPNTPASYSLGSTSYYPGEEWRGDVARVIMFMYLRYPSQCAPTDVGTGLATFAVDMPDLFLKWNAEDPVSEHEIRRNNVIFSYQGNRNPFIDNPYLATLIWTGQPAIDTWNVLSNQTSGIDQIVVYPTVTSDFVYISNSDVGNYTINVYNTLGQLVQTVEQQNEVNLSQNASGLYFLKVSDGTSTKTFKVILK
jgi:endonuclease I